MAAFLRQGVWKRGQLLTSKNVLPRSYATKAEKKKGIDRKQGPKIDSSAQSLAAKGFLRPQKEYIPPPDINDRLNRLFESVLGNKIQDDQPLKDLNEKSELLRACFEMLDHSIPNSLLCSIETVGDVKRFYITPVNVRTPLDKMKSMELPENLHVQYEYHRFHPDTDTMFDGVTAFPESSTIVTGLKYKDKYKGHVQKKKEPWY